MPKVSAGEAYADCFGQEEMSYKGSSETPFVPCDLAVLIVRQWEYFARPRSVALKMRKN
jgi:hypothetical protein